MAGDQHQQFVLLFGMPRSGTSWIGKIFDSHPLTLYKHEPDVDLGDIPLAPAIDEADSFRPSISNFFARLPALSDAEITARLPVFPKRYRSGVGQKIHQASVLLAIPASRWQRRFPVIQCARLGWPEIRIVWKSVVSLGRLGVILGAAENCRAVHIVRHPCGYVASILRGEANHKFVPSVPASEDYGVIEQLVHAIGSRRHGLTVDHLRKLHAVERLAWIWVLLNEKAQSDAAGDARYTLMKYRDVCSDPENSTKQLFSFCGMEWNSQTARFIQVSTLGAEASKFERLTQNERRYYGIFRDPIKAADKWKSEMRDEHIRRVYNVLRQSDLASLFAESDASSATPTRA